MTETLMGHTGAPADPSIHRSAAGGFLTKAEALEFVHGNLKYAQIPPFLYFSVGEWRWRNENVLRKVAAFMSERPLAVRSSARCENLSGASLAGHFRSCLNVENDRRPVREAVERVIASMGGHRDDQVLIQEMVVGVSLSGVISTRDSDTGAPYYRIEYDESSATDLVTRGAEGHQTILFHRQSPRELIQPDWVCRVLDASSELERCWGRTPLHIEFAQTHDGKIQILQVRPISSREQRGRGHDARTIAALRKLEISLVKHSRRRHGVAGSTTILGQMPDWNPGELIGSTPRPLAVSLFRKLITDRVWQEARSTMGYRPVPDTPLMVVLAGRPYVDVRASFNSFLPAGLRRLDEGAVVNAWLDRLRQYPEYHDKIEFQVAQTVLDFSFRQDYQQRYAGTLSRKSFLDYAERVRCLTNRNVSLGPSASLAEALRKVRKLEQAQSCRESTIRPSLSFAFRLLRECRLLGTLPFAIVARHAFIAESILRSAMRRSALSRERLDQFRRSWSTVGRNVGRDLARVMHGEVDAVSFLGKYGHLRPGSFDILSPRYDQRPDLFGGNTVHPSTFESEGDCFVSTPKEIVHIERLIREARLTFRAEELFRYAATAVTAREHAKFVFSRHLSDALESIAGWGKGVGLSREQLSYLTVEDMESVLRAPIGVDGVALAAVAESGRSATRSRRGLRLGCLIRNRRDIYLPLQHAWPNFISSRRAEGRPVFLHNRESVALDLSGKIVCIESADPGFDWIFSMGIAGLITKFGGSNSHMAIRCAEMGIPAAVGIGETRFELLRKSKSVELSCGDRAIRAIPGPQPEAMTW